MTVYQQLSDHPTVFQSVTGLSLERFDDLYEELIGSDQDQTIPSRPALGTYILTGSRRYRFDARDRLLMAVIWLHLYPTHDVLARIFGLQRRAVKRDLEPALALLREHTVVDLPWPDEERRKLGLKQFVQEYAEVVSLLGFEDRTIHTRPRLPVLEGGAPAQSTAQRLLAAGSAVAVSVALRLIPAPLLERWTRRQREPLLALALLYLVALTAAEAITALVQPGVGMVMQSVLLVTLLLHGAIIWEHPVHRLFLSLTFVPLIRMLNLAVPLGTVPRLGWYLITGVPLALGGLVALRSLEISRKDAGLGWGRWPLVQIGVALSGLLIGYVEYQILRPAPLIDALTWDAVWFPALALLICTGFSEELIYRGIIQRAAVEVFGRLGVLYTAFLYAMLHMGFRSLENVLFVFLVGLWFGWVVHKTHNIWGVTFAHGLTNIVLFLVLPFVIGS